MTIDIDVLTGAAAPVEHCGKPMHYAGAAVISDLDNGVELLLTTTGWTCDCGATFEAIVRVPS